MKKIIISGLVLLFLQIIPLKAQLYTENSGEMIFAFSDVEYLSESVPTKMRFSTFFHIGQNHHYDFNNNFGFYTGYGIRNIGFITEENNIETRRRTYSLGVPLAFKLGSFKDHLFFYAGGEYELFFHYKQKQFIDGTKKKQSEWFSNRTKRFVPSILAGIQFPGGINLKFKYYLENFLNSSFTGHDFGAPVDYSDFNKTQVYYISLSFNFRNEYLKNLNNPQPQRTTKYAGL